MSRLVPLQLPSPFVVSYAIPTGAELAWGFREGWITRRGLVEVALAKYEAHILLSDAEERLALSLDDELDQVDDLVDTLQLSDEPVERRARLWLFLALAWLLEHRADYEDPLRVIEMLYADFEYPDEIKGLVRFMPPGPGQEFGVAAIESRWREYVNQLQREYHERQDSWAHVP